MTLRPASLSYFSQSGQSAGAARGQNFTVHRFAHAAEQAHRLTSGDETLLIFPDEGGELSTASGKYPIPARALVIVTPGQIDIRLDGPGSAYALTTAATVPSPAQAINAAVYQQPDPRVTPLDPALRQAAPAREAVRIYEIDKIPFPVGNPRLKLLRTATMSINWVEYDGPRNRAQLSPHAHTDFEQGSLAIAGNFIHHIRTPWKADANQWREDQHIEAAADSVLVIPPELIHTTEGVGPGRHVLIDIFAPPREDFIAKGWVHNADEYAT